MVGWVLAGFGAIFLIAGLAVLVAGLRGRGTARESLGWPAAPATITVSEVREAGENSDRSIPYEACIRYSYRVAGIAHEGKRIAASGQAGSGMGPAQADLARYPVGARVMAYYDPARPDFALLEPGSTRALRTMWIVGGVFVAAGSIISGIGFYILVRHLA